MLPWDWNDLDLESVAVTAAVGGDGVLSPVGGLWAKLGDQTVDLARRGLLRTVVVALGQDDVPSAYLAVDATPLRVVKATTLEEAARKLQEEARPRQAVCEYERRATQRLEVFDRHLPIENHYQALPLLREVRRERLPREADRTKPGGKGDISAEDLVRWEEELRQERVVYQRVDLSGLLADFRRAAPEVKADIPRVVIVGPPGSGKSTLTQYLAWRAATGELRIGGRKVVPARVPLRRWERWASPKEEKSLPAYLAALYADAGARAPGAEEWRRLLARGDVFLLLDGLDELEGDPAFDDALTSVLTAWRDCPTVLTCRTISFEQHRGVCPDFPVFALSGLDHRQQEAYVRAFPARNAARFDAERLLERLRLSPQLALLASNPLLLAIFCFLVDRPGGNELPAVRAAFYDQAVQRLLAGERKQTDLPLIRRRRILERAALRLFIGCGQGRQLLFDQAMVLRALSAGSRTEGLDSPESVADALLADLTRKPGILRGDPEHGYFFLHLAVHEFLAASALARLVNEKRAGWETPVRADPRRRRVREFIDCKAWDPRWQEVITLLAGQLDAPGPLLEMLSDLAQTATNPHGDDYFHHRLALATQSLPEIDSNVAQGLRDVIDRITAAVVSRWSHNRIHGADQPEGPMSQVLPAVAWTNGRISGVPLADWLCRQLAAADVEVQMDGLSLFARMGAAGTRLPGVAVSAARALTGLLDRQEDLALAAHLERLEKSASYAPELIRPLLQLAAQGRWAPDRWLLHVPESTIRENFLPTLLTLASDAEANTRNRALRLLGELAGATDRYPEVIPALLLGLVDEERLVRVSSIWPLARIRDKVRHPEVLAGLRAALRDSHPNVRLAAADVLGQWGEVAGRDSEMLRELIRSLGDPDDHVWGNTARALERLGNVLRTQPNLLEELCDTLAAQGNSSPALASITALTSLGTVLGPHPLVISSFLNLCFANSVYTVEQAHAALEQMNARETRDRAVQPRLIMSLLDEAEELPRWVFSALEPYRESLLHHPGVIDALIHRLLHGSTPPVRRQAIDALQRLGVPDSLSPEARSILEERARSTPERDGCLAATVALAWVGEPGPLFECLASENPSVRDEALWAVYPFVRQGVRHPLLLRSALRALSSADLGVGTAGLGLLKMLSEEVAQDVNALAELAGRLWEVGYDPWTESPSDLAAAALLEMPCEALSRPEALGPIMNCSLYDWGTAVGWQTLPRPHSAGSLVRKLLSHGYRIFRVGAGWHAHPVPALAQ